MKYYKALLHNILFVLNITYCFTRKLHKYACLNPPYYILCTYTNIYTYTYIWLLIHVCFYVHVFVCVARSQINVLIFLASSPILSYISSPSGIFNVPKETNHQMKHCIDIGFLFPLVSLDPIFFNTFIRKINIFGFCIILCFIISYV